MLQRNIPTVSLFHESLSQGFLHFPRTERRLDEVCKNFRVQKCSLIAGRAVLVLPRSGKESPYLRVPEITV